ncbi:MAG: YfiR family protein [Gammaproteobacteria bacterium]|nr:YfiR family protein [Gammaproteobacteria bacterium]
MKHLIRTIILFTPDRRFIPLWRIVVLLLLPALPLLTNAETPSEEYDVKLAYLFNIARFTTWEGGKASDPLPICLIGTNPFGEKLKQLAGRKIQNRSLQISFVDLHTLAGCRLLFISASERQRLQSIQYYLASAAGDGILTVSDLEGFVYAGGMVQLFREGSHVRIAINSKSVEAAGLRLSAQLQQLARTPPEVND